jgi:hypothetical protein
MGLDHAGISVDDLEAVIAWHFCKAGPSSGCVCQVV